MSGMAPTLDLKEVKKIRRLIRGLGKMGGRMERPLKQIGVYMVGQTGKTFDKGGRGPVKWKPLADVTKIMRKYRKPGGGRTGPAKILRDRGTLAMGTDTVVRMRAGVQTVVIYNKVPHGKTHQFPGGKIKIPAKTIRPKKPGGVLVFNIGGRTIFARKVFQPAKTKDVPQRQFLFWLKRDLQKAKYLVNREVKIKVQKAARGR